MHEDFLPASETSLFFTQILPLHQDSIICIDSKSVYTRVEMATLVYAGVLSMSQSGENYHGSSKAPHEPCRYRSH